MFVQDYMKLEKQTSVNSSNSEFFYDIYSSTNRSSNFCGYWQGSKGGVLLVWVTHDKNGNSPIMKKM